MTPQRAVEHPHTITPSHTHCVRGLPVSNFLCHDQRSEKEREKMFRHHSGREGVESRWERGEEMVLLSLSLYCQLTQEISNL